MGEPERCHRTWQNEQAGCPSRTRSTQLHRTQPFT